MAFTLGPHAQTPGGATGGTSSAIDTTGMNLIVVSASYFGSGGVTINDSKGNTYTSLVTSSTTENNVNQLFYCLAPTVGSGHTFTDAPVSGSNFCISEVLCFSGAAAASVINGTPTSNSAAATTVQPGSQTPSQANCLIVTGSSSHDSSGASINGGFTKTDESVLLGGANYAGAAAYLIQTSSAAANPTWTVGAGSPDNSCTTMAVFNAAAGGGAAAVLAATPADVVTVTAALTTAIKLAATPAASSTVTAAITTAIKLAATPAAASTVTAALTTGIPLAAAPASLTTVTAALTTAIKLAATPASVVTINAALLEAAAALEASPAAVSTVTAALTTAIRLAAAPAASSTVTAAITTAIKLSAAPISVVSIVATLVAAATVPKLQVGTIPDYDRPPLPIIPGGAEAYMLRETGEMAAVIQELILMCPQSATAAPIRLKDGMKRLARNPWWPVSGQVRDEWVYYDGAAGIWRYFITEPTTT